MITSCDVCVSLSGDKINGGKMYAVNTALAAMRILVIKTFELGDRPPPFWHWYKENFFLKNGLELLNPEIINQNHIEIPCVVRWRFETYRNVDQDEYAVDTLPNLHAEFEQVIDQYLADMKRVMRSAELSYDIDSSYTLESEEEYHIWENDTRNFTVGGELERQAV